MSEKNKSNGNFTLGIALILLGIIFLFKNYFPDIDLNKLWPFALIVVGVVVIINGRRDNN